MMIRQGDRYISRGLFRLGRRTVLIEREGRGTIGAGVRVSVADLSDFFDKQQ